MHEPMPRGANGSGTGILPGGRARSEPPSPACGSLRRTGWPEIGREAASPYLDPHRARLSRAHRPSARWTSAACRSAAASSGVAWGLRVCPVFAFLCHRELCLRGVQPIA